jgi:hypothetical protein
MIRFTVEWDSDVELQFTEVWLKGDGDLRQRLTKASDIIDRELSRHPGGVGESIPAEPALRGWILPDFPKRIGVYYRIFDVDQKVRVVGITVEV